MPPLLIPCHLDPTPAQIDELFEVISERAGIAQPSVRIACETSRAGMDELLLDLASYPGIKRCPLDPPPPPHLSDFPIEQWVERPTILQGLTCIFGCKSHWMKACFTWPQHSKPMASLNTEQKLYWGRVVGWSMGVPAKPPLSSMNGPHMYRYSSWYIASLTNMLGKPWLAVGPDLPCPFGAKPFIDVQVTGPAAAVVQLYHIKTLSGESIRITQIGDNVRGEGSKMMVRGI